MKMGILMFLISKAGSFDLYKTFKNKQIRLRQKKNLRGGKFQKVISGACIIIAVALSISSLLLVIVHHDFCSVKLKLYPSGIGQLLPTSSSSAITVLLKPIFFSIYWIRNSLQNFGDPNQGEA